MAFVITGGHTAEMLALASKLDKTVYQPRCYVVGHTDSLGSVKAAAAEKPVTPQVQVGHLCACFSNWIDSSEIPELHGCVCRILQM